MSTKKIIICKSYGGFSLSDRGRTELRRVFPEISKDLSMQRDTIIRDRQDVIEYILKNGGLERFQGDRASLAIVEIPSYVSYRIHEYDGMEGIIREIPYERVIDDLVRLNKGETGFEMNVFTPLYIKGDKEAIKKLKMV